MRLLSGRGLIRKLASFDFAQDDRICDFRMKIYLRKILILFILIFVSLRVESRDVLNDSIFNAKVVPYTWKHVCCKDEHHGENVSTINFASGIMSYSKTGYKEILAGCNFKIVFENNFFKISFSSCLISFHFETSSFLYGYKEANKIVLLESKMNYELKDDLLNEPFWVSFTKSNN